MVIKSHLRKSVGGESLLGVIMGFKKNRLLERGFGGDCFIKFL